MYIQIPRPRKFVFDNGSEFKQDFTPLINYFDIKPVLTTNKKPQAKALMERVHQLILNIIVAKYIYNKVFDHIYPWGETLASISWAIRSYYLCTMVTTPGQDVFGR